MRRPVGEVLTSRVGLTPGRATTIATADGTCSRTWSRVHPLVVTTAGALPEQIQRGLARRRHVQQRHEPVLLHRTGLDPALEEQSVEEDRLALGHVPQRRGHRARLRADLDHARSPPRQPEGGSELHVVAVPAGRMPVVVHPRRDEEGRRAHSARS